MRSRSTGPPVFRSFRRTTGRSLTASCKSRISSAWTSSRGWRRERSIYCQEETDKAYLDAVIRQSRPGPRDLKIIYSPLHGVGESAVMPTLTAAGFSDVEVFEPHREPSGDFPNVPGTRLQPGEPGRLRGDCRPGEGNRRGTDYGRPIRTPTGWVARRRCRLIQRENGAR